MTPTESRWLLANYFHRGPAACARHLERTTDEVVAIYKALRRENPGAIWPFLKTAWLCAHGTEFTIEVVADHLQLPERLVARQMDLLGLAS